MCYAFDSALKCEMDSLLPTGIYTIPEVSMVGAAEEDLREKGVDFVVGRADYANNARGEIIGDKFGFLKLIFSRPDMKLIGVHAIGEQRLRTRAHRSRRHALGSRYRAIQPRLLQLSDPGRSL